MKAIIARGTLAEETNWVSRVIPQRPTNPILNGLVITTDTADGTGLQLSATDASTSSVTALEADIVEPGTVIVPGKLLAAIAGSLPQQPVTINLDGSKLSITCGRSKFALPTYSIEDYPKLPTQPDQVGTLPGSAFSDAVQQVVFAAAKDESLPVITGAQIRCSDTEIVFVATDRYRLAIKTLPWNGGALEPFVLRAKSFAELAKPVSPTPIALSLDPAATLFGVIAGTRRSVLPLLEGTTFPDVQRVIPTTGNITVTTDTVRLVEAVKRVRLVMDRPNQPAKLTFGNDEILIAAGDGDAAASEAVEATIDGDRIEIAFNPEYLVDGLVALAGETTRFRLIEPNRPVLLDSPDDDTYRHVLMPVRLN